MVIVLQIQGNVGILVYNIAAMKIQLVQETALSTFTVVLLQTMKAVHVRYHATRKRMAMSAALMQFRLDVFVSHRDHE